MPPADARTDQPPSQRRHVGIVGAGVSGLVAAHVLARTHRVTLFEAADRLGGHADTHEVSAADGERLAVDTGFIVHNDRTYPVLQRLFAELDIATVDTQMSMSIVDERTGLAYAGGRGVTGFVARPRQWADRRYLRLLRSVRRFHADASALLESGTGDAAAAQDGTDGSEPTYGQFLAERGYPAEFVDWYAVPLVACVWSTGPGRALDYPARYLFRFLDHHGMLSIGNSPQWRTIVGGSRRYVDAIAAGLDDVRLADPVRGIARTLDGVRVRTAAGRVEDLDQVVIATHADTALRLLDDPTAAEKEILGAFGYTTNEVVLHRDTSLLPGPRWARASWNYLIPGPDSPLAGTARPVVTYDMNRLQHLRGDTPLLVTLGGRDVIAPETIDEVMTYDHPIYDAASVAAQRRLPELTTSRTAYAGAHHGWGFHEDGARSGLAAARALGGSW